MAKKSRPDFTSDLAELEKIKKLAIVAVFSDDELMERLVLKGGNALDLIHGISTRDLPPIYVPVAMRVESTFRSCAGADSEPAGGEEAGVQGQSPWRGFGGRAPKASDLHWAAYAAGV